MTLDEPGTEAVSSDTKYQVLAGEADGYYKLILSVATAFLGGSMLFLERLAPRPIASTLILLALGWAALIGSIFCVADVRRLNLESLRHAMEANYDDAKRIDRRTRAASLAAQWFMIIGMTLIGAYGFINVALRAPQSAEPQSVTIEAKRPIPVTLQPDTNSVMRNFVPTAAETNRVVK